VRTVLLEDTRRRELAEFVTDHVLSDKNRNEGTSVVNVKSMSDEIWSYRGTARPSLDGLLDVTFVEFVDLFEEFPLHERAFFE
jgi:hypothetical protein